jgi:hypothetical protein
MTQLQRLVLFTPPALNATGQSIVNELRRLGFPPSDTLLQWIRDALERTGSKHFEVKATASDATAIGFTVAGTGTMRTWWGDGATAQFQLSAEPMNIGHAYATGARRPVVLIGDFVIS